MLIRAFCSPGIDAVAISKPTFTAYEHFARLQGARVIEVPLTAEFDFDADAFIAAVGGEANVKLVFICSPNNPTGNEVDPALILRVADALPETIIVARRGLSRLLVDAEPRRGGGKAAQPRRAEDAVQGVRPRGRAGRLRDRQPGAHRHRRAGAAALSAAEPLGRSGDGRARAVAQGHPSRSGSRASRRSASGSRRFWRSSPIVLKSVRSGGGNFLFLQVEDAEALGARLRSLGIRVRFRPERRARRASTDDRHRSRECALR